MNAVQEQKTTQLPVFAKTEDSEGMAEEGKEEKAENKKATVICTGTILGHMPRKSNSRRIVVIDGKHKNIKSKAAILWMTAAVLQVQMVMRQQKVTQYTQPVALYADIYYRSERSDLSSELLMDCLEKADLIKNDRQIHHQSLTRYVDKYNPRVEWTLENWKWRWGARNDT